MIKLSYYISLLSTFFVLLFFTAPITATLQCFPHTNQPDWNKQAEKLAKKIIEEENIFLTALEIFLKKLQEEIFKKEFFSENLKKEFDQFFEKNQFLPLNPRKFYGAVLPNSYLYAVFLKKKEAIFLQNNSILPIEKIKYEINSLLTSIKIYFNMTDNRTQNAINMITRVYLSKNAQQYEKKNEERKKTPTQKLKEAAKSNSIIYLSSKHETRLYGYKYSRCLIGAALALVGAGYFVVLFDFNFRNNAFKSLLRSVSAIDLLLLIGKLLAIGVVLFVMLKGLQALLVEEKNLLWFQQSKKWVLSSLLLAMAWSCGAILLSYCIALSDLQKRYALFFAGSMGSIALLLWSWRTLYFHKALPEFDIFCTISDSGKINTQIIFCTKNIVRREQLEVVITFFCKKKKELFSYTFFIDFPQKKGLTYKEATYLRHIMPEKAQEIKNMVTTFKWKERSYL